MANSPQALKRAKQAEKRRQRNASRASAMRTGIKKVVYAVQEGNKDKAVDAYKSAVPLIDSAANHGLIHKNKAARHKSRLNSHIKAMG